MTESRKYQAADESWVVWDGTSKTGYATEAEADTALLAAQATENEMARAQEFISEARAHAKAIWEAQAELQQMQQEWNALTYGDNLPDGDGDNAGYTKDEVGAVVFAVSDAIQALLNGGHATSIAKLL